MLPYIPYMDPMGHENAATFAQTRDFFSLSSHQKVALKMDDEMAKQFHRKIHFLFFLSRDTTTSWWFQTFGLFSIRYGIIHDNPSH